MFFKTFALAATMAAGMTVPEHSPRDLAERASTCTGPDGNKLTCPSNYNCVGGRGCCPKGFSGACFFRRDGGTVDERDIINGVIARSLYATEGLEARDLAERTLCTGADGSKVSCPSTTVCSNGRGCCPKGHSGLCFFLRDGGDISERDVAEAMIARDDSLEARDVEIEKRACASGKKNCNGRCIPNADMCCYGVDCPTQIAGWACKSAQCGCAYKGSCSL